MGFIKSRIKSFRCALQGLLCFYRHESNAKIIFIASLSALLVSALLELSPMEWILVLMSIVFVNVTELINSSLEHALDLIHPEQNPSIKHSKDLAAAATLLASIFALMVGLIVYCPKILEAF